MDRDRAVNALKSAGLHLEAAWLEAFAPTAEDLQNFDRENAGNPSGHRHADESDDEYVRRVGWLVLAWRRIQNGEGADERELANSWYVAETIYAMNRPAMFKGDRWEIRPNWFAEDDEDEDAEAESR